MTINREQARLILELAAMSPGLSSAEIRLVADILRAFPGFRIYEEYTDLVKMDLISRAIGVQ